MATVSPAGATVERSNLSNVVGVIALLAVIALIYFIARGRGTHPVSQPLGVTAPTEQSQPLPPAIPQK
jgi:hypothetical protein